MTEHRSKLDAGHGRVSDVASLGGCGPGNSVLDQIAHTEQDAAFELCWSWDCEEHLMACGRRHSLCGRSVLRLPSF